MERIRHNHMELTILDNGRYLLSLAGKAPERLYPSDRPNFEINVCGDKRCSLSPSGFLYRGMERKGNELLLTYENVTLGLTYVATLTFLQDADVITVSGRVTNRSDKCLRLTRFSSLFIEDLAHEDGIPWYENEGLRFYLCHNKWQGEGQWQSFLPHELGIYPATTHEWEREGFTISSCGNWSTANFYPLILLQDEKSQSTFFCELEGAHNWHLKVGSFGGYRAGRLFCEASGFDENDGYWYYDLIPGESLDAERAILGLTPGGPEAAAEQLVRFKRADSTAPYESGIPPVVYNVYMNGIWGLPSVDRLMPLIDRAAEVGCEIFVIDGGWSRNQNGNGIGDWLPGKWYEEMSLPQVAAYIASRGMKPGIWLELDSCQETAYGTTLSENALLTRHGLVIGRPSCFYNFTCEEIRAYLAARVDELYRMGFRYIKNDFNHSVGIGADLGSGSPAAGLVQNSDAFNGFIDELREKYPDLIIENCGSGALRDDNKTLRRFHVQSTSDQELYQNNPTILSGTSLLMPPEKEGMWAYPYPALFDVRETFSPDEAYIAARKNGHETAFNMVTAMLGTIFLSGRIDHADEENLSLIREAISLYKGFRAEIPKAYPIFPNGFFRINQKGVFSYGLRTEGKLLLAVWNIGTQDGSISVPLSDYAAAPTLCSVYAAKNSESHSLQDGTLTVRLPAPDTAALFVLDRA